MIKKFEYELFEKRPIGKIFIVLVFFGLIWWIAYWPGTLQYDSCGQLLQYIGVGKMTGHHPYPVTMAMGVLLDIGRALFSSDNMGIFLYSGLQFVAQCLVISYGFLVFKHMKLPMWIRWFCLWFYGIFPLIPNWGISYGKDSGYYICFLLFIFVIMDVWNLEGERFMPYQKALWVISLIGLVAFRNDGRYVAVFSILLFLICSRRYWREYVSGVAVVFGFLFLVEGVYMPLQGIPEGSVREALSVPMLQTVKYIETYEYEITEDEKQILLKVFEVEELGQLVALYDSEISDPVKNVFKEYPEKEELLSYLKVWVGQFIKHPWVYVEAYWEHCDGYFNPLKKCYDDIIGWFSILDGEKRTDEYLDIYFVPQMTGIRTFLKNLTYQLYEMPIMGCLFHPGMYTWLVLCCGFVLFYQKRYKYIVLLVPCIIVLLICTASPLNASVRYYLPVMASSPAFIALCTIRKGVEK